MAVYVRPEIRQGGFQRTLCGDVLLVGSEWLNETWIDVVVRGTPEETNSGMFERPDVPIPGIKTKGLVIQSASDVRSVLCTFLNACGNTVLERDPRTVQPGLVAACSRNSWFENLVRGEAARTRGGQHTTRLARVMLQNTHEPLLLSKFDAKELHCESLCSLFDEAFGSPGGIWRKQRRGHIWIRVADR
jgi:hypothetical protein